MTKGYQSLQIRGELNNSEVDKIIQGSMYPGFRTPRVRGQSKFNKPPISKFESALVDFLKEAGVEFGNSNARMYCQEKGKDSIVTRSISYEAVYEGNEWLLNISGKWQSGKEQKHTGSFYMKRLKKDEEFPVGQLSGIEHAVTDIFEMYRPDPKKNSFEVEYVG